MKKIILIVDDYADARGFMKYMLESYGYKTLEAINGLEAVRIVKNQPPDIILMDISMPIMDGLTATAIIRDEVVCNIPIVAITAFGNLYQEKALEAGCNELVTKPVDVETLKPILEKYLNN
jgi:two-component system, cell cycle response regulator DivK